MAPLWMCTALTGSFLEGLGSMVGAPWVGAVLACPNLCVESADVEQHTALLKRQGLLLCWDPRERVVPVRGSGWEQFSGT